MLAGLVVAVRDTLRVRKGGLVHGGHPCNGLLGKFLWCALSGRDKGFKAVYIYNIYIYTKQLLIHLTIYI